MAFKLPMDGFKKVSEDKHKTVLKHESGHEITIAHGPLSHKMKSQLKALPMAEEVAAEKSAAKSDGSPTTQNFKGNESSLASVSQGLAPDSAVLAKGGAVGNPKLEESKKSPKKPKKFMADGGSAAQQQATAKTVASLTSQPFTPMAQGGSAQQQKTDDTVASLTSQPFTPMADGGDVAEPAPSSTPTPAPSSKKEDTKNNDYQVGEEGSFGNKITKAAQNMVGFADGGSVDASSTPAPDDQSSSDKAMHIGSVIGHAVRTALGSAVDTAKSIAAPVAAGAKGLVQGATNSDQPPAQPQMAPVDPQLAQASQDLTGMSAPQAQPQAAPDQSSAQPPAIPQPTDNPNLPGVSQQDQPTLEGGYANQLKGIGAQAAAQGNLGNQQAAIQGQAVSQEANALSSFQQNLAQLKTERSNLIDDIQNSHIDPNHYMGSMDTGKKIQTGIGLILGGLGGGLNHTGNPVLQMLQSNIDRDIDAQKANLGKKQTLLSENLKQYGNLYDATNVTKMMMNDITVHQLDQKAAAAQSPLAKAAALQAKGALQQQMAPIEYQYAMRRTLMGIGQGATSPNGQPTASNLSSVDPASFIKSIVPEGQQKPVADEIERAQNTYHMSNPIMENFDKTAQAMQGTGHLTSMIRTPREMNALSGLLNTTVTDLTGTARQAEFDNIHDNFLPKPTDTANDMAIKRQALQQYLQAKSSAPLAKANGIDLTKFRSTNNTPEAKLNPQAQQLAQWAKQNPTNPKAQMVLKKLGLQ